MLVLGALMGSGAASARGHWPSVCPAGDVPGEGIYPHGSGCLLTATPEVNGFTISPAVVEEGQLITGTVAENANFSPEEPHWEGFVRAFGGHRGAVCPGTATSCSVRVTIPGGRYIYNIGVTFPQFNTTNVSIVSGYVTVIGRNEAELSGTVVESGAQATPRAGIAVEATGPTGHGTATTDPAGDHTMELPKGRYTVAPIGERSAPHDRVVTLERNQTNINFVVGEPQIELLAANGAPLTIDEHGQNGDAVVGSEIFIHGTGWEPSSGPIELTLDGERLHAPVRVETPDFTVGLKLPPFPGAACRATLQASQADLDARAPIAGSETAGVEIVEGGVRLDGRDRNAEHGDALCAGEDVVKVLE